MNLSKQDYFMLRLAVIDKMLHLKQRILNDPSYIEVLEYYEKLNDKLKEVT